MVDHTFLFTGAVRKIKELVDEGVLGPLYYYDSTRVNLGLFQHDVNVIWDLAPHDLSIMDYLIGLEPELVVATGGAHLNGMADMAYITLYFPKNIIAHINVNWLSPVKVRTTLIGGQRKMLVWNDLEPDEKIKVYDKGVEVGTEQGRLPAPGELPERRHVGAPGGARPRPCSSKPATSWTVWPRDRSPSTTGTRVCAWSGYWRRPTSRSSAGARSSTPHRVDRTSSGVAPRFASRLALRSMITSHQPERARTTGT